jgi:hypothetical protein
MRTKGPVVVASLVALSVFVVASGSVLAQLNVAGDDWYEIGLRGESILRFPPVVDAPFSAEVLTVWRPRPNTGRSELRATSRYYRDRAGRVRVEQTFVDNAGGHRPQRIIVAPDPDSKPVYVLDPVAQTTIKVPRMYAVMTVGDIHDVEMPISPTCFIGFPRLDTINRVMERHGQAPLVIDEESLGEQSMAGVRVAGTRYRTTVPVGLYLSRHRGLEVAYERWVSAELKLEVYVRTEDSEHDVVEHRLTGISRAEPPATLFEVAADYQSEDYNYKIPATRWLNPYAPEIWPNRSSLEERCARPFD